VLPFVAVSKPLSISSNKRKHGSLPDLPSSTQETSLKKRKLATITPPPTPPDFPSIALEPSCLIPLQLAAPPAILKRKRSAPAVTSPPTSPSLDDAHALLPKELDSLKRLNAAFLSALTLHYAHNGHSTSADLRVLMPCVTRVWKKRNVTVEDIRLLLAIIHSTTTSKNGSAFAKFCLKDYGQGKVCLEFSRLRSGRGAASQYFNESQINTTFATNLESAWESWSSQAGHNPDDVESFISSIDLEPLATSATVAQIAPLRANGQRRLEEVLTPFKNFNLSDESPAPPSKRARNGSGPEPTGADKENAKPVYALDRSVSLLDRIKAKEAHAASLPAAPTKEQRERMAALQRSEEVLEIMNLLALAKGGSSRVSFPLPSLVRNLQSSIRSPLSKEELIRCVNVLQTEIAPGHISMVTFGSVTGIVVERNRKPTLADVKARLKARGV
jgi:hypothetical protein